MNNQIEIAKGVSIETYLEWKESRNKFRIASMVHQRLFDRYIKPHTFEDPVYSKEYKDGFAMMASACLMIEAYWAFKSGEEDTEGKSKTFFCEFLNAEPEFSALKDPRKTPTGHYLSMGLPSKFYKNVRCGILYQGETKEGWTISPNEEAPLFEKSTLAINPDLFIQALKAVLKRYKSELIRAEWESPIWVLLLRKMGHICTNSQKTTT